jgi:hypothetical protein
MDQHGAHHGVWCHATGTEGCQLQAAFHIWFVNRQDRMFDAGTKIYGRGEDQPVFYGLVADTILSIPLKSWRRVISR